MALVGLGARQHRDDEEKFNAARAQDPTISVDLVIEYTQDEWDALSDDQKGLYLSNKERVDRGIAPYAAVAKQVSDVAQDYATYLLEVEQTLAHSTTNARWTGSGRDASFCCDPSNRLAAALGDEKEFFAYSENLAWTSAGTSSAFPEPVAYSVYAWIYDDSGSNWGHRHFSLAELNDNAGEANVEGLAGFGVARGDGGTYTVMNVADEAAGWDYASDSNLVLWSSMVGGNSGTTGDASASDPSPSPSDPSPSPSENVEEATEDTGNGGLIAAIAVVVATLLIAFAAFATWQHALFNPEGCSARAIRAVVGDERFRAAYRAPRSWRSFSCLAPPAPDEEPARERRGFFGLFRGGKKDAEKEEGKEARGGGLFGLFRGGKDGREEDKTKKQEAKEARGGGLFGLFRGGKDGREEDKTGANPPRRRARGVRAAPAARHRDTGDPSARAAPFHPPIGAILRALARAAGARGRAEATPRPPVSRRAVALVASCLVLSLPHHAAAAGLTPRVVSRVAIHPEANDVTAAATASSRSRVVAALGTAAVPGRVHFLVSDAPDPPNAFARRSLRAVGETRWTHDGAFALPAGTGAVRSAAVASSALHPNTDYFAFGTDRSPGVVVPAGALNGTPAATRAGEDVLAVAVASEAFSSSANASAPCFVFATWTSPTRLVRFDVHEETRALRRAAGTTLPLGVNRVRAAVVDPRRFSGGASRVAHFASDASPSALVTVRTDDLAIVDALVFPSIANESQPATSSIVDGSRVFRGAILTETSSFNNTRATRNGNGVASYWVTRPSGARRDEKKNARGSNLFRVAHRRADGGGAVITNAYAFRATERAVAAIAVERTTRSPFGSDAPIAYVAFDAGPDDGDGDAAAAASVVALVERRDERTGVCLGFARIATVAVPGARALTPVRVADGVATYATRGSPAELVEIDFFATRSGALPVSGAVAAMRGPDGDAALDATSVSFESSSVLCVAFANATHFGATFLFAGGRVGAGARRLVSAALAARGAAKGETWRARPC